MPGNTVPTYRPNRRKAPRRRTRLRSGKVIAMNGLFINDCLIHDRSTLGVRIRMAGRTPLPRQVKFFDDELRVLRVAQVIWQRDNVAGLAFMHEEASHDTTPREISTWTGKFYALRRQRT